ncbi:hypothetical protein BC829DRAFT_457693 [Chytridium lagenaria]|nr:hypothetical protein BC829DRAFT_457693 [Chytridium lagenaria]
MNSMGQLEVDAESHLGDTSTINAAATTLASIRVRMSSEPSYGITPETLGEICDFDKRTSPSLVHVLDHEYGGVEGVALLLRSDVQDGVALKILVPLPRRSRRPLSYRGVCAGMAMCPADGWLEGTAIFIAVFIVLAVTAGNDYQKDLKFKKLLLLQSDKRVKVIRGGVKDEVSSWDVMVGDVVDLSTGDEIPADGIFINGNRMVVDESPLTGESIPVKKSPQAPFMFSGCQVSEGVGAKSSGGQIQELLNEAQSEETPMQKKLKVVAILIGKIGVAVGIATFLGLTIRWAIFLSRGEISGGGHACQGSSSQLLQNVQTVVSFFVVGITMVVVAVPEGLPLAVTISLAFSMFKMIKDNCFATCVCTDKTGTLTENKMTVVKVLIGDTIYNGEGSGASDSKAFDNSTLSPSPANEDNGQDQFIGSATEGAMLIVARKMGFNYEDIRRTVSKVENGVWSFSSDRKRMSTLVVPVAKSASTKNFRLYTKGASEIVFGLCTHMLDRTGTKVVPISPEVSARIQENITTWASEGLRTLGLAYKDSDKMMTTVDAEGHDDPENDLVWIGLIGIKDPLRKEVPGAVAQCQRAGLTIRMVTGDNILTACKIAQECNILYGDLQALEGPVFRAMSKEERIAAIPKLAVLARSSPADKHILVSLLRELGEVVAVTGDGTNDAPALKEADVGFAMGISGTQIARNASDIVLLDDNFVSIVQSIRWGRNVLDAVRKFLQFQLAVNLMAITLTFIGSVTVGESPLTTVQLLWVNLIMDSFGALALASETPDDNILLHPPHRRKDPLLSKHMWAYMIIQIIYQLSILLSFYLGLDSILPADMSFYPLDHVIKENNKSAKRVRTTVFTAFVFLQVSNIIMSRQLQGELNPFRRFFSNKLFLFMVVLIIGIQVLATAFGGTFLSTVPLVWKDWVLCVGVSLFNFVVTVIARYVISKTLNLDVEHDPIHMPSDKTPSRASTLTLPHPVTSPAATKPASINEKPSDSHSIEIKDTPDSAARANWAKVRSATVLIGQLQEVQRPQYQRDGPTEEFVSVWRKFRKDVKFATKAGSIRRSESLRSMASFKSMRSLKSLGRK